MQEPVIYSEQYGWNTHHSHTAPCTVFSWIPRGVQRKRSNSVLETHGLENQTHLLMEGAASHGAKGRQTGQEDFEATSEYCPGPHEGSLGCQPAQSRDRQGLLSEGSQDHCPLRGSTGESGAATPCSPPRLPIFCLPPSALNELTVLLFRANSSFPLERVTSQLLKEDNTADYSFSNPSRSITTFIHARPLNVSQADLCTSLLTIIFALTLHFLASLVYSQHSSHVMQFSVNEISRSSTQSPLGSPVTLGKNLSSNHGLQAPP